MKEANHRPPEIAHPIIRQKSYSVLCLHVSNSLTAREAALEANPRKHSLQRLTQTVNRMITPDKTNIRPRRERSREHLTQEEVGKLLAATKDKNLTRNPERDHALVLLMVRHGLRVSEACKLKFSDVDLQSKVLHVKRLKNGKSTTHPLYNGEVKALRDWLAVRQEMTHETPTLGSGDTVFISERRSPLSRTMIWVMINKFAKAAGLSGLNVHPHALRHSTGYDLATVAPTPGSYRTTSDTRTSSTQSSTRRSTRAASQTCTEAVREPSGYCRIAGRRPYGAADPTSNHFIFVVV